MSILEQVYRCEYCNRIVGIGENAHIKLFRKCEPERLLKAVAEATETEMVVDGQMVRFVPKERQSSTNDKS